jgi:hypothetical protein
MSTLDSTDATLATNITTTTTSDVLDETTASDIGTSDVVIVVTFAVNVASVLSKVDISDDVVSSGTSDA